MANSLSLGDWFILVQVTAAQAAQADSSSAQIGENIDTRIYLDLIAAMAKSFQSRQKQQGNGNYVSSQVGAGGAEHRIRSTNTSRSRRRSRSRNRGFFPPRCKVS